jgi:hypothetical protein
MECLGIRRGLFGIDNPLGAKKWFSLSKPQRIGNSRLAIGRLMKTNQGNNKAPLA